VFLSISVNLDKISLDELLMKRKSLRRRLRAEPTLYPVRIAVLGGSTTSAVVEVLEILLLLSGFAPSFHESEYGRFYDDPVHDPRSLIDFRPDIVYIHTSCQNIRPLIAGTTEPELEVQVRSQLTRFRAIWDAIDQNLACQVIQNNFELPPYAILGNMEATASGGYSRFLMRLNEAFAEEAIRRPKLLIQDIHGISARIGLDNWFDWDRFFSYKILLKPAANHAVALSLNALIRSTYGKSRKVLVLDLDNTLWGGVIGDDGVDKIQIGRETPIGEAYTAFQEYCLALRNRGILLAVCSKNMEEIARAGFEHPSSVLRLEHISCFKANWSPKHENLLEIAKALNIGTDSLVFVDDNPAERAIIEAQLPDVAVPDVGSEVSRFSSIIDAGRYFEPVGLSREDLERAALYAANTERVSYEAKFSDYGEYLDSLEMTAEIERFKPIYLERIAQLTNKTNQYNLTTRRYTLAEIESLSTSDAHICLYGRLTDRFADNGLISVVLGSQRADTLHLDLWLMSCRVLKRDMEFAMLDAIAHRAAARGIRVLVGTYLPSKKNAMVADHYERLGFTPQPAPMGSPEGATFWICDLNGYSDKNKHIKCQPHATPALDSRKVSQSESSLNCSRAGDQAWQL
jgi:FkbH-like protein